jgi:hypothetical protein
VAIVTNAMALSWLGLTQQGKVSAPDLDLLQSIIPKAERLVKKYVGYNIEYNANIVDYYPLTTYGAPQDPLITGWELQGGRATPIERFADERRILTTYQLPIRSVTSIYEDPAAWINGPPPVFASKLVPQDYQVDFQTYDPVAQMGIAWSGFIIRMSGIWLNWARSIQVTYAAGLTPAELDPITGTYPEFAMAILTAVQVWYGAVKAHQVKQATGREPGALNSESIGGYSASFNSDDIGLNYAYMNALPQISMKILEGWVRETLFI